MSQETDFLQLDSPEKLSLSEKLLAGSREFLNSETEKEVAEMGVKIADILTFFTRILVAFCGASPPTNLEVNSKSRNLQMNKSVQVRNGRVDYTQFT